ncbi:hypothetical protein DFH07DRAFT_945684 [Mycena maculata]|uniref:Uncharacterized protein n=1 Tax=Mycena maculata TaxID=230809 RepID=A0AAD7MRN0_9AGAR|nr:hypothetical protein DFH07DRAFT_945684 [Mycena maculata]
MMGSMKGVRGTRIYATSAMRFLIFLGSVGGRFGETRCSDNVSRSSGKPTGDWQENPLSNNFEDIGVFSKLQRDGENRELDVKGKDARPRGGGKGGGRQTRSSPSYQVQVSIIYVSLLGLSASSKRRRPSRAPETDAGLEISKERGKPKTSQLLRPQEVLQSPAWQTGRDLPTTADLLGIEGQKKRHS